MTEGNGGAFRYARKLDGTRDRALYDGHAVAGVAAIDKSTAKKALKLIKVTYEKLPHVTDVDDALEDDAPIIQPRYATEGQHGNLINKVNLVKAISTKVLPKLM